jgi:hypothetical protein
MEKAVAISNGIKPDENNLEKRQDRKEAKGTILRLVRLQSCV